MIISLIQNFADALAAMPRAHPRYRILKLLDEAMRRDVHFIDRHPTPTSSWAVVRLRWVSRNGRAIYFVVCPYA